MSQVFIKNALATSIVFLLIIGGIILSKSGDNISTDSLDSDVTYACEPGATAYSLLAKVHKLEIEETEFGPMVLGIDGVKPGNGEFWAFYIDDLMAPVGADAYTCTSSEKIVWRLEKFI